MHAAAHRTRVLRVQWTAPVSNLAPASCVHLGRESEELSAALSRAGIRAAAYHAGLSLNVRNSVHKSFMQDNIDVVVATVSAPSRLQVLLGMPCWTVLLSPLHDGLLRASPDLQHHETKYCACVEVWPIWPRGIMFARMRALYDPPLYYTML